MITFQRFIFPAQTIHANHDSTEVPRLEKEIDLKVGAFKPEYAGKMQFYLSALNDTVRLSEENPSIGIILCKEKSRTFVEYALKDSKKPIGVSTYKLTSKLPRELKKYLPAPEEMIKKLEELG